MKTVRAFKEKMQKINTRCLSVLQVLQLYLCNHESDYDDDDDDDDDDDSNSYIMLHLRIANHMVMDSRCRGGIVNTRGGFSRARRVRRNSPTAPWRFRVSTSNSPIDRKMPNANTPVRHIYHTYAQQDTRVCGDDHF